MKTMSNRAIFSRAESILERAGFEYVTRQTGKQAAASGNVYAKSINGKREEVVLTYKVAKEIVESI